MAPSIFLRTLILPVVLVLLLIQCECMYGVGVTDCGQPDCSNATDGGKVADPSNCRQFYFCVDHEPTPEAFVCDDGMVFNLTTEDCIPGDTCVNLCSPCSYECSDVLEPSGYVADRYDCTLYHECSTGDVYSCTENKPFFDGSSCQTEKSNCCSCKPYCSATDQFSFVIDPTNCKRYFFCDIVGGVPQYSLECEVGNFDITTKQCSESAPCILLCPNNM